MKKNFLPLNKLISIPIGIIVCVVTVCAFSKNPGEPLAMLFTGTFTNKYYFGTMLNSAAFFMIAGLGSSVALKCGNMNLGGEGQIYLGGFIAGLILSSDLKMPSAIVFLFAILCVMISGALMASVSALLKETKGAEVLLTTFLVSSAVLPLIDGAITASKGGSGQNLLALPYIKEEFRFARIMQPSPLTMTFFAALIFCAVAYFIFTKTFLGRRMKLWGTAPLFASYSGLSSKRASYISLSVSSSLHALTGMFAVCGTYFTCHNGFYSGMGWNALSAALIASSNPLALIPTSIFLSWLYTSAGRVSLTQGFGFDISGIIQGAILFSVALNFAAGKKNGLKSGRTK